MPFASRLVWRLPGWQVGANAWWLLAHDASRLLGWGTKRYLQMDRLAEVVATS